LQRRDHTRAFAIAVLAAGLSFAGPGAFALAADTVRLAPDTGGGRDAPPFVARLDTSATRVALQPARRAGPDDAPARRPLLAILPGGAPRLEAPAGPSTQAGRPARHAPGRPASFVRTSRGPPLG
jgi:hypothetical protein